MYCFVFVLMLCIILKIGIKVLLVYLKKIFFKNGKLFILLVLVVLSGFIVMKWICGC